MNLGGAELLIVVAIAVLLFGAGWLPKAAKNLGKAKVEMEKAQEQFNDAKSSVVEATGVKELEATIAKTNKVLKSTPQNLLKDAAKSAATGGAAKAAAQDTPSDDDIEDAEIVDEAATRPNDDVNINVDFDEG